MDINIDIDAIDIDVIIQIWVYHSPVLLLRLLLVDGNQLWSDGALWKWWCGVIWAHLVLHIDESVLISSMNGRGCLNGNSSRWAAPAATAHRPCTSCAKNTQNTASHATNTRFCICDPPCLNSCVYFYLKLSKSNMNKGMNYLRFQSSRNKSSQCLSCLRSSHYRKAIELLVHPYDLSDTLDYSFILCVLLACSFMEQTKDVTTMDTRMYILLDCVPSTVWL